MIAKPPATRSKRYRTKYNHVPSSGEGFCRKENDMKLFTTPTLGEIDIISSEEYTKMLPPLNKALYPWLTKMHIETTRGPIEKVIQEIDESKMLVDVLVASPTPEHEYYTIVTSGMSFKPMEPPPTINIPTHQHAELYMHLPKDWKLDKESLLDPKWAWPVAFLLYFARYPHVNHKWVGWGSYLELADSVSGCMGDSSYEGCLLLTPLEECPDIMTVELNLLQQIFYYNLFPAYMEEIASAKQPSTCCEKVTRLEELLIVNQMNGPLDIRRKNVITNASY